MNRNALIYLKKWFFDQRRKPLVMRGARQVGKTWLVRALARECGVALIELNFEDNPHFKDFFTTNDPKTILLNIESYFQKTIVLEKSLLFLDEIQAMPELFAKLRWFYEGMPSLAVIAAGSLLEFMLEDYHFSVPVGRITYFYLEPLSFEEFLQAHQKEKLVAYLSQVNLREKTPAIIHEQLLSYFKEYIFVGGLPEVVDSWVRSRSLEKINNTLHDILTTYRDDFSKYARRMSIAMLDDVLNTIPNNLGKKFIYRHVHETASIESIKKALSVLCQARLCHRVQACHGNGLPLEAEKNHKLFKIILLDTGLVSAALHLSLHQLNGTKDINLINQGAISEQVVGQLLRTISPFYIEPRLYYWAREAVSSNAEVDYLMQYSNKIIPIEVKSGAGGSLKSLHYFMADKKFDLAVRINSETMNVTPIDLKNNTGQPVKYQLLSIPFYLIGQIDRLLEIMF